MFSEEYEYQRVRILGQNADLLVTGIGQLLTMADCYEAADTGDLPRAAGLKRGHSAGHIGLLRDAAVACRNGVVVAVGPRDSVESQIHLADGATVLDAEGKTVAPGFVDAHTHLVFGGWRAEEYAMRVSGRSYLEISRAGGGIASTVKATRAMTYRDLLQRSIGFLDDILCAGTTSCEVKSGYGLDQVTEIKQLQVIQEADAIHPVSLVPTYLGAHSIPEEYRNRRQDFVGEIAHMLPIVKEKGLAQFVDVYCDVGAFSLEEAEQILSLAKEHGFGLKIHADELENTGSAELGCSLGAASCDHLLKVSSKGISDLAAKDTVAVLLPATSTFLGVTAAPARALLDAGAGVALGTDFNPGTSTAMSLPLCMTLACSILKMTPEEAWVAATWNSAYASGLGGKVGAILPNYAADLVFFAADDYREIPYRFGSNLVHSVVKRGEVVVREGSRVG